ncbi:MAG: thiol peroxidase [Candidatus Competibacterales bacterium]
MPHITLKSSPHATAGDLPAVDSPAPAFRLTDSSLKDVTLADFAGKTKVISTVPSVDTPVCATSTRKFNDYAKAHPDVAVLVVSADLPFAQKRLCGAESLDQVTTLSCFRSSFAKDYGLLIEDGPMMGLCARAVIIIDATDKVRYLQLVTEIADEPDYQAALDALVG